MENYPALSQIAQGARKHRAGNKPLSCVLAYLCGALRYSSRPMSDLLDELATEAGDMQRALRTHQPVEHLHTRLRRQQEVIDRLMDVVHEEALQRNQWYNHEEEERLRDVAAAAHGG